MAFWDSWFGGTKPSVENGAAAANGSGDSDMYPAGWQTRANDGDPEGAKAANQAIEEAKLAEKALRDRENGESTRLGYGFAASRAVSLRGYRDGVRSRSRADLDQGVRLLKGEYDAHLINLTTTYRTEISNCLQILSKSGGISEAFDEGYKSMIRLREDEIKELHNERALIARGEGQSVVLTDAYCKGYADGVVNVGGSYLLKVRNDATN